MVIGAEHRCFGMRLENRRFLDPIYCKKPRSTFVWWERTYKLHNLGRRVMTIIGEESQVLKSKICVPQGVTYERCKCFLHRQDTRWSRSCIPVLRWSCEL
jgi:hypothetical protein